MVVFPTAMHCDGSGVDTYVHGISELSNISFVLWLTNHHVVQTKLKERSHTMQKYRFRIYVFSLPFKFL